jgi:hypothetical protein
VSGRIDNIINTGGIKVSGEEIEHALLLHPAIGQCAVVGQPDDQLGQRVEAYLVVRGERPDAEEVGQFLRQQRHLAGYKVPKAFHWIEAMPTGPTGKLFRSALRRNKLAGHAANGPVLKYILVHSKSTDNRLAAGSGTSKGFACRVASRVVAEPEAYVGPVVKSKHLDKLNPTLITALLMVQSSWSMGPTFEPFRDTVVSLGTPFRSALALGSSLETRTFVVAFTNRKLAKP